MMKTTFLYTLTIWLAISFFPSKFLGASDTPTGHVRQMLDRVMAIQTAPEWQGSANVEKRRKAIQKVIAANIAFDDMSAYTLGDHWPKLTPSEQKEFSAIFKDLFIDSYTRMVLNFIKKEKVLYNKEEKSNHHYRVATKIVRANDEIEVDYTLKAHADHWLITDIKVDGVSIADNYRRAFGRVIKQKSFQVLLDKMRLQQKAIQ